MKKFIVFAMLIMAIGFSSCSDVEMPDSEVLNGTYLTRSGQAVTSEDSMLSFNSQEDFQAAVSQLESLSSEEEKTTWVKAQYPNFRSIQILYKEAMDEMADIEDLNEERYNAFQQKYMGLYFPKYMEDAGFYVPMSNLDASYLVNKDCNVEVGGTVINLRDIEDYNKLTELGRSYYSNESPMALSDMASFNLNSTSMNSVGPEYDSGWKTYDKRKVKLKARRRFTSYSPNPAIKGSKSLLHLEFCFRKKTWIGWVNYSSTSTIVFKANIPGLGWTNELTFSKNGSSSHDSEFEYPIKISSDASHTYYTFGEAPCVAQITFRGVSSQLNYSWNMPGCQCITPRTSSPVLILPSY